ncbi:MAG: filamentous hemagglutinin N-terminal domain-containing protein [Coleofasciculus sp. S288]|nr:filamentous hemagglutinin N-terminal domain-containing protein [Coleofasciculus sp. S288]
MKGSVKSINVLLTLVLPAVFFQVAWFDAIATQQVQAQTMTPEVGANSTGTIITTPDGSQFDITGGIESNNNLFHSFERFGLDSGQIANFLANPQIQNILSRVVGGDASMIDGLIRVTSQGKPNLFLMNPAGIIFGANASLDVPASFTVTTARGIGFENGWFNAFGANEYAALGNNPNKFAFTTAESGSIINAGNLTVGQGENITLLGGTVISTGTLSAPAGQITVAAVAGEKIVRISQDGQLLSLELQSIEGSGVGTDVTTPLPFTPLSLPQLLTGGSSGSATNVRVNDDGTISLTGSNLKVDAIPGTAIASGSLNTVSQVTGGTVNILGDRVGLIAADINASGTSGGGIVRIGGDYRGQGTVPNASQTYVSWDSAIAANGLVDGNGGQVTVWADNTTQFDGSISVHGGKEWGNGGVVEVSGKQNLIFDGEVDLSARHRNWGTLLLDPANIIIVDEDTPPGALNDTELDDGVIFSADGGTGDFTISRGRLESLTGNITLEATNDITINDLASNQLNLQTTAGETVTFTADADNDGTGSFVMNSDDTIRTQGGAVEIVGANIQLGNIASTGGAITLDGSVTLVGDVSISTGEGVGGDITFTSTVDSDGTFSSRSLTLEAGTGNVTFADTIGSTNELGDLSIRGNNVSLRNYAASSTRVDAAGDINLTVEGDLDSSSTLMAGANLNLQSPGDLTIEEDTRLSAGANLTIQAQGDLTIQELTSNGERVSAEKNLALTSGGNLAVNNSSFRAGENLNIESQGNINFLESQLQSPGNIQLVAQNTLQVTDSEDFPFFAQAGGTLHVQGNEAIDIQALENPLSWFQSGGDLRLVNDGNNLITNGRFASGGTFSINQTSGAPANFTVLGSDGIISSQGDVSFGNYEGVAFKVEARGSITGGNITITGANTSLLDGIDPNSPVLAEDTDIATLVRSPALILRAGVTELQHSPSIPPDRSLGGTTFSSSGTASSPGNIRVGNINTAVIGDEGDVDAGGPVILSATGNIYTGAITTGGDTFEDAIFGSVNLSAGGNIDVETINTSGFDGGDVTITAGGVFRARGYFYAEDTDFDFSTGDDINSTSGLGSDFPVAFLPTSISATGTNFGGASIQIQQGGEAFIVGPLFEQDANGNVIFRLVQRDADDNVLRNPDGSLVLGEQVFFEIDPVTRDVVYRSADGTEVFSSDEVAPQARSISANEVSSNTSFTAGGITSNQQNEGVVVSFRDRPLVNTGTFTAGNGRIRIVSTFTPDDGNGGTDNGGTDNGGGGNGGIGNGGGGNGGIGNGGGGNGSTGNGGGGNGGGGTDNDNTTDNSDNGSSETVAQDFEQQDERSQSQDSQTNQCRISQEQSESTMEESDRSNENDEEECEELELLQQQNSQPRLLRIELHLPPDADSESDTSTSVPSEQ